MAIIQYNPDGTFKTKCSICREPITIPYFATSHFLDRKDSLWKYSDSAMHWECYANWHHQKEFASKYYSVFSVNRGNPYWKDIFRNENIYVSYGHSVDSVGLLVRQSGCRYQVKYSEWKNWLNGKYQAEINHDFEERALISHLPLLKTLNIRTTTFREKVLSFFNKVLFLNQ